MKISPSFSRQNCLLILLVLPLLGAFSCSSPKYRLEHVEGITASQEAQIKEIYQTAKLQAVMPKEVFRMAMVGLYHIPQLKKPDRITIVDYSRPSTQERFFVIDLQQKKVLYKSLVAHGVNSGNTHHIPSQFSNVPKSRTSSLGFFLTAETYDGKNGFSLRLDGLEKDINHLARKRAIVIHGADYTDHQPNLEPFEKIIPQIPSKFFTMDIAQKKDGAWIMVELGDGQVAGLPEHADLAKFYTQLNG